jgi:hypothetical protein
MPQKSATQQSDAGIKVNMKAEQNLKARGALTAEATSYR